MIINGIRLDWNFEPSIVVGLTAWEIAYWILINRLGRDRGGRVPILRQAAFHLGTACAFVALLSPLDALSDEYLFSAHMTQHMLLMFAAAPLWLVGVPGWLVEKGLHFGSAHKVLGWLVQPGVAFVVFTGTVWVWHIPAAYDAALSFEPLHIGEHLLFIAAALVGWWPVLGPSLAAVSPTPLVAKLGYLVASLFACTALAALITLAQRPLFTFYGNAPLWLGLTPLVDQQLGGVVMWVPADMLYVYLIASFVYKWLEDPLPTTQPGPAPIIGG